MSCSDPAPSRQLYLNTRYANYVVDNTKQSQVTFCLNEPIQCPNGYDLYASVLSAEIPNTITTVDTSTTFVFSFSCPSLAISNQTVTLTTSSTIPWTAYNLIVPTGNYSGQSGTTINAATLAGYLSKKFIINTPIINTYATTVTSSTILMNSGIWTVNDIVVFTNAGVSAAGLTANTQYYVITVASATTLTLSTTFGGSAITLTATTLTSTTGACSLYDELNFVTTWNPNQNRFNFSWSSYYGGTYTMTCNSPILGLNASGVSSPYSPTLVPKLFPNYLLIGTNLNCYNQAVGQSKLACLSKVVLSVPYGTWIYMYNNFLYPLRISNREIGSIEVVLYDEYGNVANMNGANWSITIQIDIKRSLSAQEGSHLYA